MKKVPSSHTRELLSQIFPRYVSANPLAALESLRRRHILVGSYPEVPAAPGEWLKAAPSRPHRRLLHGFAFLGDAIAALASGMSVQEAIPETDQLIVDWVSRFSGGELDDPMAYHDEATALRLHNLLAYRTAVLRRAPTASLSELDALVHSTADLLADEDFHAGSNNHGMFQDVALLEYVLDFPELDVSAHRQLATARLRNYLLSAFTSEGVHKEHAPSYHLMVSRQLGLVSAAARELDPGHRDDYRRIHHLAERYATHMVNPAGFLPPLSDSFHKKVENTGHAETFLGDEYQYAVSQGRRGRMPDERNVIFPASGYAIFRERWGDPDSAYAVFSAAYHGAYHKHSDDLSLYLYRRGREVLREAGAFGYDYSDRFTKYGYSSFAHNSLIVNQGSLPRHDGQMAHVALRESESPRGICVVGRNERWAGVVHERTLLWQERGVPRLLVHDKVECREEKSLAFLWHVGADIDIRYGQSIVAFFERGSDRQVLEMRLTSKEEFGLRVVYGDTRPRILGWHFPRLGEKAPNFTVVVEATAPLTTWQLEAELLFADYGSEAQELVAAERTNITADTVPDYRLSFLDSERVEISVPAVTGIQYAFYLYSEREVIERSGYSGEPVRTFRISPGRRYRIRVFRRRGPEGEALEPFTTDGFGLPR